MLCTVQLALTVFSALLLPLALPNELFSLGMLLPGLVALVPVFLVVYRSDTWRQAARLGALFGAISTAVANYWLAFFGDFSVWTIGGAVLGYTGYNYILFGYLHYLVHGSGAFRWRAQRRATIGNVFRPLRIAVAWTAYEYLKSVGFLGYPWGLVAYPLATWLPLAQGAELAGVWGLSFLAAWINSAIAEAVFVRENPTGGAPRWAVHNHLIAVGLVCLVTVGFGFLRLHQLDPERNPPERSFQALLVQQNVDSWEPGRFSDALARAQLLTLTALQDHANAGGCPVDFVVWSETSLRRSYHGPDDFYRTVPAELPFVYFLDVLGMPLITGAPMPAGTEGLDFSNSAIVIDADGTVAGIYAKQQLVPFAESIPFWEFEVVREFFRGIVGVYGTWMPGRESTVVPLTGVVRNGEPLRIGLPICFEDGFGWVPREMVNNGAELLVNLTNNSWSRQDSAQTQHYVAARVRSIELRTTLVRGTNSGLSGVVDPRGVLVDSMPMFESTAAVMTVPVPAPQWTGYRAIGDLPGIVAVVWVLGYVILMSRRWRRDEATTPITL